jgi:hypothetical protein
MTRRVHHNSFTDSAFVDALSNFNNHTRTFVPKHFWRCRWEQALRDVNVGAANAYGVDFYNYSAGTSYGIGNLIKRELVAAVPGH